MVCLQSVVKLNVDLAAKSAVGKGIDVTRNILSIPIPPGFGVPRIFSIGPSIELVASSELSSNAEAPMAVLLDPVVFNSKALLPTAVLEPPVVFDFKL